MHLYRQLNRTSGELCCDIFHFDLRAPTLLRVERRCVPGAGFASPKPLEIVRQSMPFGTVGGESGLFFIGFAAKPDNFEVTLVGGGVQCSSGGGQKCPGQKCPDEKCPWLKVPRSIVPRLKVPTARSAQRLKDCGNCQQEHHALESVTRGSFFARFLLPLTTGTCPPIASDALVIAGLNQEGSGEEHQGLIQLEAGIPLRRRTPLWVARDVQLKTRRSLGRQLRPGQLCPGHFSPTRQEKVRAREERERRERERREREKREREERERREREKRVKRRE